MSKKRDVSLLVSAAGWIGGFVDQLVSELHKLGVSDEAIHQLVTEKGELPIKKIAEELVKLMAVAKKNAALPFKYDKTNDGWTLLKDVKSSGSFNPDFVLFLKPGEDRVNGDTMRVRAKELNANLGQRDLEWLEANQHLIPESERGHYIVATGTVWLGVGAGRSVACLGWSGDRWYVVFFWLGGGWDGSVRLLGLRAQVAGSLVP